MEEKDDMTCGREGDGHPFTEINLQDEFVTPIMLVLNYSIPAKYNEILWKRFCEKAKWFREIGSWQFGC